MMPVLMENAIPSNNAVRYLSRYLDIFSSRHNSRVRHNSQEEISRVINFYMNPKMTFQNRSQYA